MNNFPKILVAAPTSSAKHYCFPDWLDNALKIVYPNFKIVLFDNTMDNGESVKYHNDYYKKKYGKNADQFECIKSDTTGLESSLIARICRSHNDVRDYAIKNNYAYLFHLESDVIPKVNFLQELLLHKKDVAGALYFRDEGRFRRLMVQIRVFRSKHNIFNANFDAQDDVFFIDGTLKPVAHIGLGCVLIKIDVLKKIAFRFDPRIHAYPDSFFAEDLFRNKIKIWADTSLIAEHRNKNWFVEVYNKYNKA